MPRFFIALAAALPICALPLVAQSSASSAPVSEGAAGARISALTDAQRIAAATLPLPVEFRPSATVLGAPSPGARVATLRAGSGAFVCLAPVPGAERFHVACYHRSLEPFMARGRALRLQGVAADRVDSVRFAEVRGRRLALPRGAATLYSLTGPPAAYDPAANTVAGARPLVVVYMPGATEASTGLSTKPQEGVPWLMFPGTPKAHLMFTPRM